ncbi:hypothetical protein F0726_02611 [Acidithiobacillus caldus]|nr:hypothetical protein F0726_02611 [Acidithiobacillus caldus]
MEAAGLETMFRAALAALVRMRTERVPGSNVLTVAEVAALPQAERRERSAVA